MSCKLFGDNRVCVFGALNSVGAFFITGVVLMFHKNMAIWLFLIIMGVIFMLTDGGLVLGSIMSAVGVVLLLIRIFYKQTTEEHPEKKIKIKRKYENPLYGGLLLLFIGFFAIIAEVGTTFPIILMVIGGLLVIGTLFYVFVIDIPKNSVPQPSQTPKQTTTHAPRPQATSHYPVIPPHKKMI